MSRRTRSSRATQSISQAQAQGQSSQKKSVIESFDPDQKADIDDGTLTSKEQELIDIVRKEESYVPERGRRSKGLRKKGTGKTRTTPAAPTAFTRPQLYSQTLMSKAAALARINLANVPPFIDSEWKLQLNHLGEPWKRISTTPATFEAYKQIVALFGEPQNIRKDRTALVWNVPSSMASLPVSSFGLLTKKRKWLRDGIVDRVEFKVNSSLSPTTTMEFPYPELSSDQKRALQTFLTDGKITYDDGEEVLIVSAPTLFECWVYAGIISGYLTYKFHRSQLRSGEIERRYLQGLGEPFLQDNILEELMSMIEVVQENGSRQPKPGLLNGETEEDLFGNLTLEEEDIDVSPSYVTLAAAAENEGQLSTASLERGKHLLLELSQEK